MPIRNSPLAIEDLSDLNRLDELEFLTTPNSSF
jgi:hypothetical protein